MNFYLKNNYFLKIITNLVCLGDNHIEIDAAHVLAKFFIKIRNKIKSLFFIIIDNLIKH